MNPIDVLDPIINQLISLKGPKQIIVFLIMFGYLLKMIPSFPNVLIPIANCFVLGPALSVLLLGWPTNGEIAPTVRYPEIAAWAQAYQTGLLLGCIAWISHGLILRKVIDEKVSAWKDKPIEEPIKPINNAQP